MVSDSQIREARRKALSGLEGLLKIVGFKVTTEGTIIRSRHNQQQCRPGGECSCRRRQKGRKCERRHASHPQASVLHWEAGLKPLYVRDVRVWDALDG